MEKKKFRINILDFLIVAIVVLAVCGVALRQYAKEQDAKLTRDTAIVTFLIRDVQAESANSLKEGDAVYSPGLDCEFGTIVGDVEVRNAVYYHRDGGAIIAATSSDGSRVDIVGRFTCEGNLTEEGGFAIDGTQYIAAGMQTYVFCTGIDANITILDVEIEE